MTLAEALTVIAQKDAQIEALSQKLLSTQRQLISLQNQTEQLLKRIETFEKLSVLSFRP